MKHIFAAAFISVAIATPALATPPVAIAGAHAGAAALSGSAGGDSSTSVRQGGSSTYAGALGQAPLGVTGCLASTRILFGLVETSWTAEDCLAMEAAKVAIQAGDINLAREMIGRAIGE